MIRYFFGLLLAAVSLYIASLECMYLALMATSKIFIRKSSFLNSLFYNNSILPKAEKSARERRKV